MDCEIGEQKSGMLLTLSEVGSADILTPNFSVRYSGVTATLERVARFQCKTMAIAITGFQRDKSLPFLSVWRWPTLWRKPGQKRFRIWHARRNSEMFVGFILRDVLRMPIRLVFTSAGQRHHTAFTRFLISRMDAVIATSPESASYLSRPSRIIRHGIDFGEFHPATDRAAVRARMALPDRLLVGCFGRIRREKGTDLFVDAMIEVIRRNDQVSAVISGLRKKEHERFEREIRTKIEDSNLADRFHWLGEQPPENMPELFRSMDIYVCPQRWEGHGVTPLEAMASAVPVVATTVGAFAAQIVDGVTGFLVPPRDAAKLAEAIVKLIADPDLRVTMGKSGRASVVNNFNVAVEADQINKVYRELWAGRV